MFMLLSIFDMCDSIYESEWIVKLWIHGFISVVVLEEAISSVNKKLHSGSETMKGTLALGLIVACNSSKMK